MVEAVLFDLFETLITESETRPAGASCFGTRLGLDAAAFREHWKRRRRAITLGRISFVDAIAEISIALGSHVDVGRLEELRLERIRVKALPLDRIETSVMKMLQHLLNRGIQVAVISNCFAEDVATWSESSLAERVHRSLFSFDVGLAKPDPAIYREALRRLGVMPDAAAFIGDGADAELTGAQRAGLRTFRAEWFLARWENRSDGDTGDGILRTPDDVLRVAA